MKTPNAEAGFSLIELVISVTLLTVIMGAAFQLMTRSQINFDRNKNETDQHANADFAITRVAEIVRGAGANPGRSATVNGLSYLENPSGNTSAVRIRSDYDGDGNVTSRVTGGTTNPKYYLIGSEDIIIQLYSTETTVTVGGTAYKIPAGSLVMIDKTPDPGGSTNITQDVPIVIASNIKTFTCQAIGSPVRQADITIVAAPIGMNTDNPRYTEVERKMRVRLRSFS